MSQKEEQPRDLRSGVPASELSEGAVVGGKLDGKKVVLVNHGGRVCALAGECTHLGAPLAKGRLMDGELICPWHHARFRVDTGEASGAPAFEPLTSFNVEKRDGRWYVGAAKAPLPASPAGTSPSRVVIVGGGAAGHACAEMLVRKGHRGRVTVVSDDADPPYDRTFCSKQYLMGKAERAECLMAKPGFYGDNGPVFFEQCRAESIDLDARELLLAGGDRLPFDTLVIATGAESQRLDKPGFDRPEVHRLRTLEDADAIIAAAKSAKLAAVIGASFIGLEVAASLIERELEVAVIAPDKVPLAAVMGAAVGKMIRGVHEEKGVVFHLGHDAASFDGKAVTLDDGTRVEADLVVLGIGVAPRIDLARAAGLVLAAKDEGGGIAVNERLETSAPGIYAVGDVASYPDARLGRRIRVEHWVHAQRQGQHVARLLMGEAADYTDIPFFWTAHYDTGLRYLGHSSGKAEQSVEGSIEGKDFVVHYCAGGKDEAVTTCNRDPAALAVDAKWTQKSA